MNMLMYDKKLYILNEEELLKDFENLPEDLDLERNERGHFDMFIATGLSTLPDNFSSPSLNLIKSASGSQVSSGIGSYLSKNPHLMTRRSPL